MQLPGTWQLPDRHSAHGNIASGMLSGLQSTRRERTSSANPTLNPKDMCRAVSTPGMLLSATAASVLPNQVAALLPNLSMLFV